MYLEVTFSVSSVRKHDKCCSSELFITSLPALRWVSVLFHIQPLLCQPLHTSLVGWNDYNCSRGVSKHRSHKYSDAITAFVNGTHLDNWTNNLIFFILPFTCLYFPPFDAHTDGQTLTPMFPVIWLEKQSALQQLQSISLLLQPCKYSMNSQMWNNCSNWLFKSVLCIGSLHANSSSEL